MKNEFGFDLEARAELLRRFNNAFFEECFPTFWITHGTLLGAYRDQGWIPWDNDIDIDVLAEEWDGLTVNRLCARLTLAGLQTRVGPTTWGVYYKGEILAIRRLKLKGNYRVYRHIAAYPKRFYEGVSAKVELAGAMHCAPTPIEEYLEDLYTDWRVPMKAHQGFDVKEYNAKCARRRKNPKGTE